MNFPFDIFNRFCSYALETISISLYCSFCFHNFLCYYFIIINNYYHHHHEFNFIYNFNDLGVYIVIANNKLLTVC